MSIEINTAANGVNWESLLSSLGEVQKADSVEGRQNFTITANVDGATKTVTVSIPDDLEIPEDVDQTALNGLVDKLKETGLGFTDEQIAQMKGAIAKIYEGSTQAAATVSSQSKGHVLFDLYALMSLMIDVAQSQRDAAREMRTAENLSIQHAIQNQADEQRAAAMVGMIVGITCGLASAAVSIGTMAGQGVAAKTQSQIMSQSGADAAKMHSSMLQNTDSVANAQTKLDQTLAKAGDAANEVLGDFDAQMVDDQAGNLRTNLDNAVAGLDAAKQDVTVKQTNVDAAQASLGVKQGEKITAQANYDAKTAAVAEKQAALDAAKANEQVANNAPGLFGNNAGTQKVEQAQAALDTAKAEQATAKTALDDASKAVEDQNAVVANAQRDLGLANDKVTAAEGTLAKAKADYSKTVQDVAAQYQEKYQTAVERQANPPPGANKAQLKADVEAARTKMEVAFAKEAQLLSQDGVMTPSEQKDLVASARMRVDVTMDRVTQRSDFRAAERKMSTLMGINNINQAIGGVMQSTASNLAALRSAEATRTGAESKREEEMLDQTKDLFAQEQKLIDQVIQLFTAVIQAENQSMRDAIQA